MQRLKAILLDAVFVLVNLIVPLDHLGCEIGVALLQCANRFVQSFFHGRRQHQQVFLELVQVAFQMLRHAVIQIGR